MARSDNSGSNRLWGKAIPFVLRNSLLRLSPFVLRAVRATWRRRGWYTHQLDFRKLANMLLAGAEAILHKEKVLAFPAAIKIDISPLCNIRCTHCIHAHPNGNPDLEKQQFSPKQKMSLEQYRHIIDQVRGRACSVSLYYFGDPLVHPDLDEMCRIAADARLNVHVNTNFSFRLSDSRMESIIKSGVTHFTVCVDGLTQDIYQRTRVGGRIGLVLSNLRRLCRVRRKLGKQYPKIEVQYLKFQHNLHEIEPARGLFQAMGVDEFALLSGDLNTTTDLNPGNYEVYGPKESKRLPRCFWPYFATLIKYNGDVLPCCLYRAGLQYVRGGDCRVLGNVFRTSLQKIWNSEDYQAIRRLVCNPGLVESDNTLRELFCDGCRHLFHTDFPKRMLYGPQYTFEQVYTINEKGIPVRRPVIEGVPAKPAH